MKKFLTFTFILALSFDVFAWKYMTGKVDVVYVNTYGNYDSTHLNNGYCFKLKGYEHYLKLRYHTDGEKHDNIQYVHSMVLAAHLSGKSLKATYVDWGSDTSCRMNGAKKPAKWLENLQML